MLDSKNYKLKRKIPNKDKMHKHTEKGIIYFISRDETVKFLKWLTGITIVYLLANDFLIFTTVFDFKAGEFIDFIIFNLSTTSIPYMLAISLVVPIVILLLLLCSYATLFLIFHIRRIPYNQEQPRTYKNTSIKEIVKIIKEKKIFTFFILLLLALEICVLYFIEHSENYNANIYFLLLIFASNIYLSSIMAIFAAKAPNKFFEEIAGILFITHATTTFFVSCCLAFLYSFIYGFLLLILLLSQISILFIIVSYEFTELVKTNKMHKQAMEYLFMLTLIILGLVLFISTREDWRKINYSKNSFSGMPSLLLNTSFLIVNKEDLDIKIEKSQADYINQKLKENNINSNPKRTIRNEKLTIKNDSSVKILPVSEKIKLYFLESNGSKKVDAKFYDVRYTEVYVIKQRDLENNCTKCIELLGMNIYELSNNKNQ